MANNIKPIFLGYFLAHVFEYHQAPGTIGYQGPASFADKMRKMIGAGWLTLKSRDRTIQRLLPAKCDEVINGGIVVFCMEGLV